MKNLFLSFVTLAIAATSTLAWAIDLQSARSQGLVAEQQDGYVKMVKNNAEVKILVDEVNSLREKEYRKISAANGQPLSVVAKLAAGQIIQKLPAGALYESDSGSLNKK